jgi:hypothetical protein
MKAFKIEYRFAYGYGANLRYVPNRRQAFIVNAESKEEAESILKICIPSIDYRAGLRAGWIKTITGYRDAKQSERTFDLSHIQSARIEQHNKQTGVNQ